MEKYKVDCVFFTALARAGGWFVLFVVLRGNTHPVVASPYSMLIVTKNTLWSQKRRHRGYCQRTRHDFNLLFVFKFLYRYWLSSQLMYCSVRSSFSSSSSLIRQLRQSIDFYQCCILLTTLLYYSPTMLQLLLSLYMMLDSSTVYCSLYFVREYLEHTWNILYTVVYAKECPCMQLHCLVLKKSWQTNIIACWHLQNYLVLVFLLILQYSTAAVSC